MNETETLRAILEELVRINQNLRQPAVNNSIHLTIEQVAEAMNCSVNNVRNWIKTGQLPAFQNKGTLRIRVETLDRFIKKYTA